MKASKINMIDLKTHNDCIKAIEHIENDPINIVGGLNQWMSDNPSVLTEGAARKITRIERRITRLFAINHTTPDLTHWRKKLTKKELSHLKKEAWVTNKASLIINFLSQARQRQVNDNNPVIEPCWECKAIAQKLGFIK